MEHTSGKQTKKSQTQSERAAEKNRKHCTHNRVVRRREKRNNETKSRSETTLSEHSSQALTTKNLQHLNIPDAGGKFQPLSPIISDLVSSISQSSQKPSERSEIPSAQTIAVHIDTVTSSINTPGEEDENDEDETMAAKKRERSPSPATKTKGRNAGKKREEHEMIATQERGKRGKELQRQREAGGPEQNPKSEGESQRRAGEERMGRRASTRTEKRDKEEQAEKEQRARERENTRTGTGKRSKTHRKRTKRQSKKGGTEKLDEEEKAQATEDQRKELKQKTRQLEFETEQLNFDRTRLLNERKQMDAEKRELAEREATYIADAKALRKSWIEYVNTSTEQDKEKKQNFEKETQGWKKEKTRIDEEHEE